MTNATSVVPTIDFNHRGQEYRRDWRALAVAFHEQTPGIAWSEHHGGFWVCGAYDACQQVLTEWETFTSYNDLEGTGNGGRGQHVPQSPYRLELGESDPPLHGDRRRLEVPFFTPKALRQWAEHARRYVNEAIDRVIAKGEADLVDDIIIPTAARTTMHLLGYEGDWRDVATVGHKAMFTLPGEPDYPQAEMDRMRDGFAAQLLARREQPTGDLISALATGRINGELLSVAEGTSMMDALVFGGFDTTMALVGHAVRYLLENPEELPPLLEDAAARRNAVEEILRVWPSATGIARTATRDVELQGQIIRKGDQVFCWFPAANRDPAKFPDGDRVILDRPNATQHLSFSAGVHRCLGSSLAKVEADIMIEAIMGRLKGLSLVEGGSEYYPAIGSVMGFQTILATFEPGEPLPN